MIEKLISRDISILILFHNYVIRLVFTSSFCKCVILPSTRVSERPSTRVSEKYFKAWYMYWLIFLKFSGRSKENVEWTIHCSTNTEKFRCVILTSVVDNRRLDLSEKGNNSIWICFQRKRRDFSDFLHMGSSQGRNPATFCRSFSAMFLLMWGPMTFLYYEFPIGQWFDFMFLLNRCISKWSTYYVSGMKNVNVFRKIQTRILVVKWYIKLYVIMFILTMVVHFHCQIWRFLWVVYHYEKQKN